MILMYVIILVIFYLTLICQSYKWKLSLSGLILTSLNSHFVRSSVLGPSPPNTFSSSWEVCPWWVKACRPKAWQKHRAAIVCSTAKLPRFQTTSAWFEGTAFCISSVGFVFAFSRAVPDASLFSFTPRWRAQSVSAPQRLTRECTRQEGHWIKTTAPIT